ncbi:nucleotide sugar dehydrogenase [Salinicoccus roseus]|uniref:nucleotide sugar dehydrogenase n=1 Tax=Salinicoccus roseus TaxID=45670 RepID=UPI001EF54ED7|nr:nucleotide sugar dehydrogenase [Salinicoccus roseus]MCG7333061.1 nucleotide sugar dehydrogenase [Salinicoccus roseus]
MNLKNKLLKRKAKISVIGLGYVGLPIAIEFAKHVDVIGFDTNEHKIKLYKEGHDPTKEVGDKAIKETSINFTNNPEKLQEVDFHIVAVPTPINSDKTPNLEPLENATKTIGKNISKGSIIVFESTVYPGMTEDICIPILEKESNLYCGKDFKVGYSPERINPGDKVHTLNNIVKIVSSIDSESLEEISNIYEIVITAGIHKASSIKVAEAAKVVENSQRDINIAFMNELAVVFDRMGINTNDVIKAMSTKWNSLPFTPGLVGGHCIGVDPYYFLYQAEKLGYHSQIIQSGRKINDSMGEFIGQAIIKKLIETNKVVKKANIAILGVTFKENCPDTRNSKVFDIVNTLNEYGIETKFVDPQANKDEAKEFYGVELINMEELKDLDCLIFTVAHEEFKKLNLEELDKFFNSNLEKNERIIIDIKNMWKTEDIKKMGYEYWQL